MSLGSTQQFQPTGWWGKTHQVSAGNWTCGSGVGANQACKPSYIWGTPEDVDYVTPLEMPDAIKINANTVVRAMIWGF
jgi:hypothetical protein